MILMGHYEEAKVKLDITKSLALNIFVDQFMQGRLTRVLGWMALAQKDYNEAETQFRQSIEIYQHISDDEQIAWSQAGLARALMGQGKWNGAHQLLTEALWTSIEIKGFIPMIFTLPFAVQYLAREDPELASDLYQKIQSSPFLANAPYFEDVVYRYFPVGIRHTADLGKGQPSDPVNDLWATAARILSNWIKVWMEEPENIEAKPQGII